MRTRQAIEAHVIRAVLFGVCGVAIVYCALFVDRWFFAPARIPSPTKLAVTVVEDLDDSTAWIAGKQRHHSQNLETTVEAQWLRKGELYLQVSTSWGAGFHRIELWLRARRQLPPSVKGRVVSFEGSGGGAFWPVLDLTGKVELEPSADAFLRRQGQERLVIKYDLSGVCITDIVEDTGTVVLSNTQDQERR